MRPALVPLLSLLVACSEPSSGAGAGPIGAGKPSWVRTQPDEPLLDARVDVGTLRVDGGAVEVWIEFPSTPGYLATLRSMHPELELPDGAFTRERERIACGADGLVNTSLEVVYVGPDGRELARRAVAPTAGRAVPPSPYGKNPRALACLAAASKCRGEALAWPPPADTTPLDDAPSSKEARRAYASRFVPTCSP